MHTEARPSFLPVFLLLLALFSAGCTSTPQATPPSPSPSPTVSSPLRLLIEYTLTSDWGTLEIPGLEQATSVLVVERTGTVEVALDAGRISLSRPLEDLSAEPTVSRTFAVVLPPGGHPPLEIVSKHGDIGGARIAIYSQPETGAPVLLGLYDHMWTDPNNPGSPASFTTHLDPQRAAPDTGGPFRLRIEYTLTSDWGRLEIHGLEQALSVQVVERTGTAQEFVDAGTIDLYRPADQMVAEPTVSLVVEVVLLPGEQAPIEIVSKHGAAGGSRTSVSYLPSIGTPVLLGLFDHMWVDPNNPDTSEARFTVQMDPAHPMPTPTITPTVAPTATPYPTTTPYPTRLPAALTPAQPPVVERLAWAVYYPWYMDEMYPRTWSSDIWTDRPLTPYQSDDPDGIRQHIRWAQEAGLDGFLVEWCGIGRPGDNDVIDENFALVLDIAYQMDFKVAAYFDVLCLGDQSQTNLRNQLEYLLGQRATHPGYYWMNGRPVVAMYNTGSVSDWNWAALFDGLSTDGLPAIYIGHSYQAGQLAVFNGLHEYANFAFSNLDTIYADLERAVQARRLSAPQETYFWAATVMVGFDNTPLYNARGTLSNMTESDILIVDRQDSQTYQNSWETALQNDPDWIIVTSWNEWQENTHIEPSQRYGDEYLRITAEYLARWKAP